MNAQASDRREPERPEKERQGGRGKGARRRSRELTLQGLYQWLIARAAPSAIRVELAESAGFAKCDPAFFDTLWQGVTRDFDALIAAVTPYLDRPVDQLSPIEKSVLAIGAWELMHAPETPYRVAINEAVDLAKSYGGTDGHKYVNGVLDKLAGATRTAEVAARRAG
jgi:N utilization substance protein B